MNAGKNIYEKKEYQALEKYCINAEKICLNQNFVCHSHDFYEIVIVLSGSGEHIIGEKIHSLKAGDVFVIKGDIRHGFRNVKDLKMINIMYDPRFLFAEEERKVSAGFVFLFVLQPEFNYQDNYPYQVFLDEKELKTAEMLSDFLIQQISEIKDKDFYAIKYGFKTLAFYLASHYRMRDEFSEKMKIVSRALKYLKMNINSSIRLQDIANEAAVSQRHLERIFMETMGLSPMSYLTDMRLKHADVLLHTTSKTIAIISEESGFEDPNYFARLYKKKFGVSPGKNRKSVRALPPQTEYIG